MKEKKKKKIQCKHYEIKWKKRRKKIEWENDEKGERTMGSGKWKEKNAWPSPYP
jgi:hypothetical protein